MSISAFPEPLRLSISRLPFNHRYRGAYICRNTFIMHDIPLCIINDPITFRKLINTFRVAAGSMLLFAALIVWFIAALSGAGTASEQQTLSAIKQSVENGITMCYSIEGAYPESIDQLTESYGVSPPPPPRLRRVTLSSI